MAVRFLIAIRTVGSIYPESLSQLDAVANLHLVLQTDNVRAWTTRTDVPILLRREEGIIFGHLFSRLSGYERICNWPPPSEGQAKSEYCDELLTNYWGGYVAVFRNPTDGTISVMRDPSGALPCFWVEIAGCTILASDIRLLADAGLTTSVDWRSLSIYLAANGLPTPKTCLQGVNELPPGSVLHSGPEYTSVKAQWSPWDHIHSVHSLDDGQLAETLRSIVIGCVGAWASCFDHPLVGVSGGLDSSIVAAALTANAKSYTAFTMFTDDRIGDERRYARLLPPALGCELLEFQHRHADIDLSRSAAAGGARPGMTAHGQSNLAAQKAIAANGAIDAFFSGIGGDNVFCLLQSASPLVDRLGSEGLTAGTWKTVRDICDETGASVLDVMALAWKTTTRRRRKQEWSANDRFLSRELADWVHAKLSHDWLRVPPKTPRGKATHVARLTILQNHSEAFARDAFGPLIFPLLSQPIVELCLSIPTWKWCAGGQNRSVARNAFADLLPSEIIRRRSKGGPDNFACEVIERNKSQVRDLLLGGLMRQQGMLDIGALEMCLTDRRVIHANDHARISTLCEAEAWARSWS